MEIAEIMDKVKEAVEKLQSDDGFAFPIEVSSDILIG